MQVPLLVPPWHPSTKQQQLTQAQQHQHHDSIHVTPGHWWSTLWLQHSLTADNAVRQTNEWVCHHYKTHNALPWTAPASLGTTNLPLRPQPVRNHAIGRTQHTRLSRRRRQQTQQNQPRFSSSTSSTRCRNRSNISRDDVCRKHLGPNRVESCVTTCSPGLPSNADDLWTRQTGSWVSGVDNSDDVIQRRWIIEPCDIVVVVVDCCMSSGLLMCRSAQKRECGTPFILMSVDQCSAHAPDSLLGFNCIRPNIDLRRVTTQVTPGA